MSTLFVEIDQPLGGRREGGKRAKRSGKAFEDLIIASQTDARGPVLALLHIKNFAKRIMYRHRDGSVEYKLVEEKSPCDFAGSICETGQGITFDAKSTDAPSFPIHNVEVVKPHQIQALERLQRVGKQVAGFMVLCKRHKALLWLWADRACTAQLRRKPLQWDDRAWIWWGHYKEGSILKFRDLLDALENKGKSTPRESEE